MEASSRQVRNRAGESLAVAVYEQACPNSTRHSQGHLSKLVQAHQGRDANLWFDDCVELIFDPDNQTVQYLHSLADMRVFYKKEIDISSMEEILKSAIEAEKDSIVFYLGMKDLVPENRGKRRLDSIIKEEMSHINLLSKELRTHRNK